MPPTETAHGRCRPYGRTERAHKGLGKPHRTRFPTAPTRTIVILEGRQKNASHTKFLTLPEGSRPHVYKSIGGANLRLHVYDRRSKSDVRSPAIVFFFGGSWTIGSVLHFVPQAKHFAQRGIVAIVADYRVSSRHNTTAFESMSDAKSAVRWVRAHANELGVDANRIVAAGGSAGGHIALSTAVFDAFDETNEGKSTSSKPNALVLFNPEVDTTDTPSHATFADLRARFGAKARDGSPIHHLRAGLPPTLILHGKDDTLVAYSDVDRFCKESSGLGNLCQIVGYEGAGHSFFNPDRADGKWYRETLLEADRFLTKLGYLSAPSPMQIQLTSRPTRGCTRRPPMQSRAAAGEPQRWADETRRNACTDS